MEKNTVSLKKRKVGKRDVLFIFQILVKSKPYLLVFQETYYLENAYPVFMLDKNLNLGINIFARTKYVVNCCKSGCKYLLFKWL